jgi:predicted metal-dependent RNase
MNSEGRIQVIKVNFQVETIEGFSGHSDRNQIINYIRRVKPKPERIIIGHGEKTKSEMLANLLRRKYRVATIVPEVLETIKLR